MPNNVITTCECTFCKLGGKAKQSAKDAKDSACTFDDGVVKNGISTCSSKKSTSLAKLNDGHLFMIISVEYL